MRGMMENTSLMTRRRRIVYCLSSPQFGRVCLVVQCLYELSTCVSRCSFVVLVISAFICCRTGEVGSLDLRSSLILINISTGTSLVLIRCRPEGICRDAAFRRMVRKIFSPFWQFVGCRLLLSCCCCLPTSMALASGGSPMFPLVVHQPASPSIWPAVQSLRRGLSTNPGATMWCVCGCS